MKYYAYLFAASSIMLTGLLFAMTIQLTDQTEVITTQQDLIIEQADVIDRYAVIVDDLKAMIAWDDVLLNAFTHDTWDRECSYDVVPGVILADGSIRSSVIQECDDLGPIIDEKIEWIRQNSKEQT